MIEISAVSKSFARVRALRDVTLEIAAGERVAFVGSNGSGKTTLLRALMGLVRVDGKITVGGCDVATEPHLALRNVAYIPQIAPPLDAPVSEVVRAFCGLRGREAAQVGALAAQLGLALDPILPTRFRDLSGGQKQKVLAALALSADTPVLVCDEPTANLDPVARTAFFELVHARPAGSVLILCSHRIDEVRHLVDRVVELRDGSVVRDCGVGQLLTDDAVFRVEVALKTSLPGVLPCTNLLRSMGFRPVAPGRLAAHLGQAEKLEVVARLLREHGAVLQDLSVHDAEGAAVAAAGSRSFQ